MRNKFRTLRLKQLDRTLKPFRAAAKNPRPQEGWFRPVRGAEGGVPGEVGPRLRPSRGLPVQLEKAEAEDRITLKSLRAAANALGCDLVYALVPKGETLRELVEERARAQAKRQVLSVEHSMALEDQAVGRVDEAVEAETKRRLRKRGIE